MRSGRARCPLLPRPRRLPWMGQSMLDEPGVHRGPIRQCDHHERPPFRILRGRHGDREPLPGDRLLQVGNSGILLPPPTTVIPRSLVSPRPAIWSRSGPVTSSICRFVTVLARLSAWLALARAFSARAAATRWALPAATGPTFALVSDKEKGKSFSPSGKEKGAPTRPGLPVGPGERTARSPQGDHDRGQEETSVFYGRCQWRHGGSPVHARRHRLERPQLRPVFRPNHASAFAE